MKVILVWNDSSRKTLKTLSPKIKTKHEWVNGASIIIAVAGTHNIYIVIYCFRSDVIIVLHLRIRTTNAYCLNNFKRFNGSYYILFVFKFMLIKYNVNKRKKQSRSSWEYNMPSALIQYNFSPIPRCMTHISLSLNCSKLFFVQITLLSQYPWYSLHSV